MKEKIKKDNIVLYMRHTPMMKSNRNGKRFKNLKGFVLLKKKWHAA
jgi:hypothetical protein